MRPAKIMISVGEVSGDEHAAGLARELLRLNPVSSIYGMGGSHMRAAGVDTRIDSEKEASVMGFGDVLRSLSRILKTLAKVSAILEEDRPDVLVLVDFPDFNLRLARRAKALGIKVLYFIPPSVWAWRSGRIELLRKLADRIALIYPFELEHYRSRGIETACFVGHPFCDSLLASRLDKAQIVQRRAKLGCIPGQVLFTVFAGSRAKEIEKHAPILREAIREVALRFPAIRFATACAAGVSEQDLNQALAPTGRLIVTREPLELLQLSDAALLKSGTSNLQAAFYGLPFSMFFKASWLTEFIVRTFVKVKQYSMVNLIRANTVTELIQEQVNPARVAQEIEHLSYDLQRRETIKVNLAQVVAALGKTQSDGLEGETAYARTANLALQLIGSN